MMMRRAMLSVVHGGLMLNAFAARLACVLMPAMQLCAQQCPQSKENNQQARGFTRGWALQ